MYHSKHYLISYLPKYFINNIGLSNQQNDANTWIGII